MFQLLLDCCGKDYSLFNTIFSPAESGLAAAASSSPPGADHERLLRTGSQVMDRNNLAQCYSPGIPMVACKTVRIEPGVDDMRQIHAVQEGNIPFIKYILLTMLERSPLI